MAVRPVIPAGLTARVGGCKAVRSDPIFRMSWVPLEEGGRLEARARMMLAEVAKNEGARR